MKQEKIIHHLKHAFLILSFLITISISFAGPFLIRELVWWNWFFISPFTFFVSVYGWMHYKDEMARRRKAEINKN